MLEIKCIYWYNRDRFSEINFGGWSIVMEGINHDFLIEVATDFDLDIEIASWYEPPRETNSQTPETTLQRRDTTVYILKYSQEQELKTNGEIQSIYWYYQDKLVEIHFGGWSIAMEGLDRHFTVVLDQNARVPISMTPRYVPPEGVNSHEPDIIQRERGVSVYIWKYPNHPDYIRTDLNL